MSLTADDGSVVAGSRHGIRLTSCARVSLERRKRKVK